MATQGSASSKGAAAQPAEAAGPEPADGADAAPTQADDVQGAQSDDVQDVKAKYRAALQRKRGDGSDQQDHPSTFSGSRIHGEHGKAGGGRTFRRKSGG